jgi:hypothetical protein
VRSPRSSRPTTLRLRAATLIGLCLASLASADPQAPEVESKPALYRSVKKPAKPDVLVVADVFVENTTALVPTPESPIYYTHFGSSPFNLGPLVAGERMPPSSEVDKMVDAALKKQGFIKTAVGGPPPTVFLVIGYGSANLATAESAPVLDAPLPDEPPPEPQVTVTFNRREIAPLIGAHKLESVAPWKAESALESAAPEDGRLYVVVSALDANLLRKRQKLLLWRTFMSIPSPRNWLQDNLDIMIASGAPYFGHDSETPVFVNEIDRLKPVIIFGELEVYNDEAPPQAPKDEKPKSP